MAKLVKSGSYKHERTGLLGGMMFDMNVPTDEVERLKLKIRKEAEFI